VAADLERYPSERFPYGQTTHAAQRTLADIEVMAMIKKGQMKTSVRGKQSPAEMFYALAA